MSGKALIVDNDYFFVEFLSELLFEKGYEVVKAYDGKEGITRFQEQAFDLIFADIVMPKIDGKEFIRYVRNYGGETVCPIVIISGVIIEQVDKIHELGADQYLAKGPVEVMAGRIRELLDQIGKKAVSGPGEEPVDILAGESSDPSQTTSELMDALAFQHAIMESVGVGIILIDKDARTISVNPMALEVLHRPVNDLLNRHVVTLFGQTEGSSLIAAMKKVLRDRSQKPIRVDIRVHTQKISIIVSLLILESCVEGWILALQPNFGDTSK